MTKQPVDSPEPPVIGEVKAGVLTLTLNRPSRLNASTGAMSERFCELMATTATDSDVRVIVITGAGRAFCAGADRGVLDEHRSTGGAAVSGSRGGLPYAGLRSFPKPVIAAVNGPCAGIGVLIAACCDIRIVSESAYFMLPFSKLGLPAEGGLAWLLPRMMGPGNAAHLLFSGAKMSGQDAMQSGFAQLAFPNEAFEQGVAEYAAKMAAAASPSSLALIKRQMQAAGQGSFEEAAREASRLTR